MSGFKAIAARYPNLKAGYSAPSNIHFTEIQWHYYFAVRTDDAKANLLVANLSVDVFGDGNETSLGELLGPLLLESADLVQISHRHDSARRDTILLRGGQVVGPTTLWPLYTGPGGSPTSGGGGRRPVGSIGGSGGSGTLPQSGPAANPAIRGGARAGRGLAGADRR